MGERHTPGILKSIWKKKIRYYKNTLAKSQRDAKTVEEELETTLKLVKTVGYHYFVDVFHK